MRKGILFLSLLFIVSFFTACNKYSETLGNYLQVDDEGVKSDLNFKLIKSEKIGYITAKDSVNAWEYKYNLVKKTLETNKETVASYESYLIAKEEDLKILRKLYIYESASDITETKAFIKEINERIKLINENILDSYENLKECQAEIDRYSSIKPNKKLMEIVKCTYNIFNTGKNVNQKITEDYAFSLDGKICDEYIEIE